MRFLPIRFRFSVTLGAAVLFSSTAQAWEGCVGPACVDQGCKWVPHHYPGTLKGEPVTVRGKIQKLWIRHGVASRWSTPFGPSFTRDRELDWHVSFANNLGILLPNGSYDHGVQQLPGTSWEKKLGKYITPVLEHMSIARVRKNVGLVNDTWSFWPQDLSNAFLLTPEGLQLANDVKRDTSGETLWDADAPRLTRYQYRKAPAGSVPLDDMVLFAQGVLTIDQPGETDDHDVAEIHPVYSTLLPIKNDGGVKIWRVAAFTESTYHEITDCSFGRDAHITRWKLELPPYNVGRTDQVLSLKFKRLGPIYDDTASRNVNATLTRLRDTADGRKWAELVIPMPNADTYGSNWMGEVQAIVGDFNVDIASDPPTPGGYLDRNGIECRACGPIPTSQCINARIGAGCKRVYNVTTRVSACTMKTAGSSSPCDANTRLQWSKDGTAVAAGVIADQRTLNWQWPVYSNPGVGSGNYTPHVAVDASSARPGQTPGRAKDIMPIDLPRPSVDLRVEPTPTHTLHQDKIVYSWRTQGIASVEMNGPFLYEWFKTHPDNQGRWGVFAGANDNRRDLRVDSTQARGMGYQYGVKVRVRDAYGAEGSEAQATIGIPRLDITLTGSSSVVGGAPNIATNARMVNAPNNLFVGFVNSAGPAKRLTWKPRATFSVTAQMVAGEAPLNIPVSWPVTLKWEVIGGSRVTSDKTPPGRLLQGSDTFIVDSTFAEGVDADLAGAANSASVALSCVRVRVTATDKYGHTMPDGQPIARELTVCPVQQFEAVTTEREAIDELVGGLERDLHRVGAFPPRVFEGEGGLVPDQPPPPVSLEWDRTVALINEGRLLQAHLLRGKTKMFTPRDAEKLSSFGLAVARYGRANPGFVTRNPGLASKFYFDTDSQKRWLSGLTADKMGAGLRAVYNRGLSNIVESDVAKLHGVAPPALRVAPGRKP